MKRAFAKAWDWFDNLHWLIRMFVRLLLRTAFLAPLLFGAYYHGYVRGLNYAETIVVEEDDMCYAEDYDEAENSI